MLAPVFAFTFLVGSAGLEVYVDGTSVYDVSLLQTTLDLQEHASLSTHTHTDQELDTLTNDSFFIYDNPDLNSSFMIEGCQPDDTTYCDEQMIKGCQPDDTIYDVSDRFLKQLEGLPGRVRDPKDAKWLIIPFSIRRSYVAGICHGQGHMDRLSRALNTLESSSSFKLRNGADHIWSEQLWWIHSEEQHKYYPVDKRYILERVVLSYYMRITSWNGCIASVPLASMPGLWVADGPYETWRKRRTQFFYRGRGSDCRNVSAAELRNRTHQLRNVTAHSIFEDEHAQTEEVYKEEISSSRFCLVIRCDDEQTSRFVDTLAAGCIPVIIGDGFARDVSYFSRHLDYRAFTITISEANWMQDPSAALRSATDLPEDTLMSMQSALLQARSRLLWVHPRSTVAAWALREATEECGYD